MSMSYKIVVGDCRTELEKLASESIDCVVTSPPYYGLRDYGTASWSGGDKDCTHEVGRRTRGGDLTVQDGNMGSYGDEAIKNGEACPHCGAIREDAQVGLENSMQEYIESMVGIFREIRRVLKPEGTVWLNIGDSYVGSRKGKMGDGSATGGKMQRKNKGSMQGRLNKSKAIGLKPKDIMGVPWRLAFALQEDGWWLRQDIIWAKPNPMPESVRDRCTKSHEYIFLLTKSKKYYFDSKGIKEPRASSSIARDKRGRSTKGKYADGFKGQKQQGISAPRTNDTERDASTTRNKRSVWTISTKNFKGAHFATFPHDLIEPCIIAGCPKYGTVLDPFAGSGTTAGVAEVFDRNSLMIELNYEYAKMIPARIKDIKKRYGVE